MGRLSFIRQKVLSLRGHALNPPQAFTNAAIWYAAEARNVAFGLLNGPDEFFFFQLGITAQTHILGPGLEICQAGGFASGLFGTGALFDRGFLFHRHFGILPP